MSDLDDWLRTRRPEPPADLRGRIAERAGDMDSRRRVDRLLDAARDRLDAARARPGRIRASAFELLVADALVTYACEAALETEDPATALEAIAEVGRRQ